jgi:hypothetical protein
MLIKITANGNTLTLGHIVVSANGFAYIALGGNNSVETNASGVITAVCVYANDTVNRVLVGTTSGKVSKVEVGNLTGGGGFTSVLNSGPYV